MFSVFRFGSPEKHTRAVPSAWVINEHQCYYPQVKSAPAAEKLVQTRAKPLEDSDVEWETFNGEEIKSGVELNIARKQALTDKSNNFDGNLTTDNEQDTKKKRKKKPKTLDDYITSSPKYIRLATFPKSPSKIHKKKNEEKCQNEIPATSSAKVPNKNNNFEVIHKGSKNKIPKTVRTHPQNANSHSNYKISPVIKIVARKDAIARKACAEKNINAVRAIDFHSLPEQEATTSTKALGELSKKNTPTSTHQFGDPQVSISPKQKEDFEFDLSTPQKSESEVEVLDEDADQFEYCEDIDAEVTSKPNPVQKLVHNKKKGSEMSDKEFRDYVVTTLALLVDLHVSNTSQIHGGPEHLSVKKKGEKSLSDIQKIDSIEELLGLNKKLHENQQFQRNWITKMATELQPQISSTMTLPEISRCVMKGILTDDVLKQLNFTGRNQEKYKFGGTAFSEAIFELFKKLGHKKRSPVKKCVMRVLQKANDGTTQAIRLKAKAVEDESSEEERE